MLLKLHLQESGTTSNEHNQSVSLSEYSRELPLLPVRRNLTDCHTNEQ